MKENKPILITIAITLIVLGLMAWYFYRQGKKAANGPVVTFPKGTTGIPAGWSPEPLADILYNVMSGLFTFTGTKDAAWQQLIDLPTDDMVKAVYSVFDQKYFSKGKGTLTQWINDESYYDYTSGVKGAAMKRLTDLGLA